VNDWRIPDPVRNPRLRLPQEKRLVCEVESPERWNVPVNFMVSKLSTFGIFPASYQFGWGYFFAQPDSIGPADEHSFGATWKVRGTIAILLPKKK
jgi:hypothetical protein